MIALLSVQSLCFSHPDREVLRDISFEAASGEFIALMGCNGAGKSTLLDLIVGIREPRSGAIFLNGKSLAEWRRNDLARQISHLPQTIRADLSFSAEQLVLMGRYPHTQAWFDSSADHTAAAMAMQRTSCWEERSRRVLTLSGGERQRVFLAACLAQDAQVCLFDEPSLFLDIDQQLRCFDLLAQEAKRGKLCIAVIHDLNLALSYCSRVLILAGQELVVDSSTEELSQLPAWLRYFSDRLQIGRTPEGKPWVWYR